MMGYGGMMGWNGTTSGWWPLVGMFVPLVFLLVLLGGGYLILQRATANHPVTHDVLKTVRFQKGVIVPRRIG